MTDISFDSRTAGHDLPLLFTGQAQKETFVNEALARIDSLLHLVVDAVLPAPPAAPADGAAWIVSAPATGEWSGREGQIAARQAGNWLYFVPRAGMRAFDRGRVQELLFRDQWIAPVRPAAPDGGSTIDSQARAAIANLVGELTRVGIFSGV